jgi:hypothetical protein
MPTIRTEITAPTFTAEITESHLTIRLPGRHMSVSIDDDGTVRVKQDAYDLLNGAPVTPANENTPRYTPPGEYEFTLPEVVDVGLICDTSGILPGDDNFPSSGTFTIAATHWHG